MELEKLIGQTPLAAKLGMALSEDHHGDIFALPVNHELIGNEEIPALHGGAVAAFLQLSCAFSLAAELRNFVLPRTLSANFQYLAPVRLRTSYARPLVKMIESSLAVVHAEAWQVSAPHAVCAAQLTFVL